MAIPSAGDIADTRQGRAHLPCLCLLGQHTANTACPAAAAIRAGRAKGRAALGGNVPVQGREQQEHSACSRDGEENSEHRARAAFGEMFPVPGREQSCSRDGEQK